MNQGNPWTIVELNILRKHYPKGGIAAVKDKLKNRSTHAIHEQAKRYGITALVVQDFSKRWTEQDNEDLTEFWNAGKDAKFIARYLGRSQDSIKAQAKKLGLKRRCLRWSTAEKALLRTMYGKHSATAIAKKLGRSVQSVRMKAHKLGLPATRRRKS